MLISDLQFRLRRWMLGATMAKKLTVLSWEGKAWYGVTLMALVNLWAWLQKCPFAVLHWGFGSCFEFIYVEQMRNSVSWWPGASTALHSGFLVDDLSFAQFCSHFLLASLQKSLWPKFESSQGISCKWNWLSRLLTEDATIYWMETSSNRDLLELHTCLYVHYCLGDQTFSVCHVRTTFCGAPGALRFDPWALCTKQDTQATSQSPWAMLTSTELSMSKGNPICAEHQHQALTLWNALTGRRLLFASAFFFAEAKS